METLQQIDELRGRLDSARAGGRTVGLVPTMGYLHEGHQALVRAAAGDCDEVVTTIFVNPLQFAAGEDLEAYPRDIEGDSAKAEAAGSSYLFVPAEEEMYPDGRDGVATSVSVAAPVNRPSVGLVHTIVTQVSVIPQSGSEVST